MKKLATTCLMMVALFSLAACNDQEKAYKYEDFKTKVAKKEFKLEYSKAYAKIKEHAETVERVYQYQKEDKTWVASYEEYDEASGTSSRYTSTVILELKAFLENAASLEGYEIAKMDEMCTFYIKKDQYRIVEDYELDNKLHQGEMKFNKDGLLVYQYMYVKDNKAGTFFEQTVEYSYYK